MTKQEQLQQRREGLLDYINTFKDSKCWQPVSKISLVLGLSKKQVASDIKHLLSTGELKQETKQVGYKIMRTLIGDIEVEGTFKHPEVEKEKYFYDGYWYSLPTALTWSNRNAIATSYRQRPQRGGKAIPIDWSVWDDRARSVSGRASKPAGYFPPFDDENYVTEED